MQVERVVSNVVGMVHELASNKQIELYMEEQDLPCNLEGDVTRLQQALLNYVSNAIKFTKSGRVTGRVKLIEETEDGAEAVEKAGQNVYGAILMDM